MRKTNVIAAKSGTALLSRLWAILGGIALVLGLVSTIISFLPRVTVNISDPANPDDPWSSAVTITNSGAFALGDVAAWLGIRETEFDHAPNFSGRADYRGGPAPKSWQHDGDLDAGQPYTVALNDPEFKGFFRGPLTSVDLAINVDYILFFIHHTRTFPFHARKQTDGHFHWYPK